MKKQGTLIGAGIGVVLFAVFGLLPGTFLGGVMGLHLANTMFGFDYTVLSRLLVAAFMVIGVMVSGIMFITVASILGYCVGWMVEQANISKSYKGEYSHGSN